jgi:hypothetical protein
MDLDDRVLVQADGATSDWIGGSLGFKMPKEAQSGICRFDNNRVDCFSHMAVWCERIYDGSAVEHCELSNSLTRGFGYGLWPGESAAPGAMLHLAKAYPTQVILVFTSASPAKPAPLLSPSCRILR